MKRATFVRSMSPPPENQQQQQQQQPQEKQRVTFIQNKSSAPIREEQEQQNEEEEESKHYKVLLNQAKAKLNGYSSQSISQARARCNLFETIGRWKFQNRAALKMAELDMLLGRAISYPPIFRLLEDRRQLLYFADICAGPGGFTEYILSIHKWRAKGFGMTLRNTPGSIDFDIGKFNKQAPGTSCFYPFYGKDGTGDVTKKENIDSFTKYVMSETKTKGVHLVMADGGFSVEGQEQLQEELSHKLLFSQILTALSILQIGGIFVCKLFDCFTLFTVQCLWLIYNYFNTFSIIKPNQSRPANSERYVIGIGFKGIDTSSLDFLKTEPKSIHIHKDSGTFNKYISESRISLAQKQLDALNLLVEHVQHPERQQSTQQSIMKKNFLKWLDLQSYFQSIVPLLASEELLLKEIEKKTITDAKYLLNGTMIYESKTKSFIPYVNKDLNTVKLDSTLFQIRIIDGEKKYIILDTWALPGNTTIAMWRNNNRTLEDRMKLTAMFLESTNLDKIFTNHSR